MAPIKFENNIKETLEKRNLQPSESSWEKLSQRLDENERKKSTISTWWIGVAASIVLLISIGVVIMNDNNSAENLPAIVENEKENEEVNSLEDSLQKESIESMREMQRKDSQEIVENATNKNSAIDSKAEVGVKQENEKDIRKGRSQPVKENFAVTEIDKIESKPAVAFESEKLDEVVAEVRMRQSGKASVSDREIDSLLKAAQREILTNRIYKETTRTVDADALLRDVEADLERSFRDKVFDALQDGLETVKTAVAERNQ